MYVIDFVIFAGWAAFWIYWLAASVGVKTGRTRWGRFAGFRVAIILVVLFLARFKVFHGHRVTTDPWWQGIGLAVFLLGLALAIWARIYLGRNWGMPMSRKAEPELVTSGPYRFVRHPIYTGIILAMLGSAIGQSLFWAVLLVVFAPYFVYCARREEELIREQFPAQYPQYMQRTKMIVPFVV